MKRFNLFGNRDFSGQPFAGWEGRCADKDHAPNRGAPEDAKLRAFVAWREPPGLCQLYSEAFAAS